MPSVKDKSTVEAIARVFCGEGKRNKTETLKIVGYKPSYYLGGRSDKAVWGNERVIEAIKAIDAITSEKQERTLESLDKMQQKAYDLAIQLNQPSAAVSAGTAIARLYGMDKTTNIGGTSAVIGIPEAEEAVLAEVARDFKLRLVKGA